MNAWYRPVDLCMLNYTNQTSKALEYKAKTCFHKSAGFLKFCGPGMTLETYVNNKQVIRYFDKGKRREGIRRCVRDL
jgi:hypothetical protein